MDRSSSSGGSASLTSQRLSDLWGRWGAEVTCGPSSTPLRCGVSGGADSLALMALAVASGCDVTAVHVDHGQRPGSEQEADRVARFAEEIGAEFERATVQVAPGANLEARMRAARYDVLGSEAATGHTLDDQAETVLINLMRGSGIRGLGAMQPGPRRPILALRRADTEAICETLGWKPFQDPSNTDPAFVRNRVRRELVPLLNDIAGRDVASLLVRTAAHARSAVAAIEEMAGDLDPEDARALAKAPSAVAASALQDWIQAQTGDDYPIDAASVERVLAVASGDAVAAEVSGGHRISRSAQRLRVETSPQT